MTDVRIFATNSEITRARVEAHALTARTKTSSMHDYAFDASIPTHRLVSNGWIGRNWFFFLFSCGHNCRKLISICTKVFNLLLSVCFVVNNAILHHSTFSFTFNRTRTLSLCYAQTSLFSDQVQVQNTTKTTRFYVLHLSKQGRHSCHPNFRFIIIVLDTWSTGIAIFIWTGVNFRLPSKSSNPN